MWEALQIKDNFVTDIFKLNVHIHKLRLFLYHINNLYILSKSEIALFYFLFFYCCQTITIGFA